MELFGRLFAFIHAIKQRIQFLQSCTIVTGKVSFGNSGNVRLPPTCSERRLFLDRLVISFWPSNFAAGFSPFIACRCPISLGPSIGTSPGTIVFVALRRLLSPLGTVDSRLQKPKQLPKFDQCPPSWNLFPMDFRGHVLPTVG